MASNEDHHSIEAAIEHLQCITTSPLSSSLISWLAFLRGLAQSLETSLISGSQDGLSWEWGEAPGSQCPAKGAGVLDSPADRLPFKMPEPLSTVNLFYWRRVGCSQQE